jgi:hypothetical protein
MDHGKTKCGGRVEFDVTVASVAQRPTLEYTPPDDLAAVGGAPVTLTPTGDAIATVHQAPERITVQAGVPFLVPLFLSQDGTDRTILPNCTSTMSHTGDGRCNLPAGRLESLLKPMAQCAILSVESMVSSTGICLYLPSPRMDAVEVSPVPSSWHSLPSPDPARSVVNGTTVSRPGGCRAQVGAHKFAIAGDENGNLEVARHLLLQYPSERLADDIIRFCGESCDDHRGGEVNGFYTPRSCFDLGVRVIPSIPAETVSLSGPLLAADVATLNSPQNVLLDSLERTAYALS